MSETEPLPVSVVVLSPDGCRIGQAVEYDSAVTLWATTSEDPHDWDEIAAYWSRYRSPATCEFVEALPITPCTRTVALQAIQQSDEWLVLDLIDKRVFTGGGIQPLGREATLAMVTDEKGNQHCPLPLRLPPWWELHEQVEANFVGQPRQSEIRVPRTNRELLFGAAMIEDLASRILDVVQGHRLPSAGEDRENQDASYALTIEVHRDWLMTPRAELSGRTPRDLLHGSHDWSDAIIWGQRMRFEDGGPMIAASDDVVGYDDAPMGREEMIIYFDLCRELISAGWFWVERELDCGSRLLHQPMSEAMPPLCEFLGNVRDDWLQQPFEGGSPPSFMIECSRRRVPRGAGVPIMGMDDSQTEQHLPSCDCPICDMMQSGMFGVGFTSLDGHHLDLDDEFAFSTHEFREDWEREQREFKERSAEFDRQRDEREAKIASGEIVEEEFASAWSSPVSAGLIPGAPQGHLTLSFRLAEIIGDLERMVAPNAIIKALNVSFREYRESDPERREVAKQLLCKHLESTGEQYPDLLSKVVDFQAQVDEFERRNESSKNVDDDSDRDYPF